MEEKINTRIWQEEAEPDNAFAAASCHCHGYDVYGELLKNASWIEYLFLLFSGEAPTPQQAKLLEGLAIALANPGPRHPAVHAAMCGGVGGSTSASCLTAALAVGAGASGGSREVFFAMEQWLINKFDLSCWQAELAELPETRPEDIWPAAGHQAGFDPHGVNCTKPVQQTLAHLSEVGESAHLQWLQLNRAALEASTGLPLAMTGVAAAALCDLGLTPAQGEMLHLLLCLPGAAVHALEQRDGGYKQFPFFQVDIENDPGSVTQAKGEE